MYVPNDHPCLKTMPLQVKVGWEWPFPKRELALVDTYCKRDRIINELRNNDTQIVVIADSSYHNFQVDALVSPHVGTDALAYHIPGKVMAGARYALIRPAFRAFRRHRIGPVRRLLLCLGGGVAVTPLLPNLTRAVRAAVVGTDIQVFVYGGPVNAVPGYKRVTSHYYGDIPATMHGCDIAIAPASMTMLELLCCGIPTITYYLNDHQRQIQQLAADLTVPYGDVSDIIGLINDEPRRAELSQRALDTIDGMGCERVARELREGSAEESPTHA